MPHPILTPQIYLYPLVAAILFLPVCYAWGTSRTFTLSIVTITVSSVCIAGYYESMRCMLGTVLAVAMALFPLGLLTYSGSQRIKIGEPALGLGLVALAIMVASMSSWHAHIVFIDAYRNQITDQTQYLLQYVPIVLASIIAAGLWGFTTTRYSGVAELRLLIRVFVTVMALEVGLLAAGMAFAPESQPNLYPQEARVAIFAGANAAVLILGAAIAWTGVLFLNRRIFWMGTLYVAGISVWRIFELDMDFQLRASILVCVGAGLIAIGICLESYLKKRSLV